MSADYGFTKQDLLDGVEKMNSFGTRVTGSEGHKNFVDYIKREIKAMGLETKSDVKHFNRWQAKSSSIVLHTNSGNVPIHVSSPFPYSGETNPDGITGELCRIRGKHLNYVVAKNKIAVVKVRDLESIYSGIAFDRKHSYPKHLHVDKHYRGPVASSFVKFPFLTVAADMGVKAVICIWEGMSDEMVEGQYLNFILGYQGIPTVWVNESDGNRILKACKAHDSATVTLNAEREKNAAGESVCAVIEGENANETVIINTHTDGVNCVEENGAVSMLAMMRYFTEHKPKRTLVFAFVAGHFRLPDFKKANGVGDQATSLWLHKNKELWDGKGDHRKAVAGLTVEHLGCTEWKDVRGKYKQTNDVDIEIVYTGNNTMDDIYFECIEDREDARTITLRGHNFLHFGEGQSLFNVGIPEIALVTAPDYLCVESESHEMEKFNLDLMYNQTVSFIKMAEKINTKTAAELGKADPYSIGIGKI